MKSHERTDLELKRYYSISETAKSVGVSRTCLRWWLEEFGINIKQNGSGKRFFLAEDVSLLIEINRLVHINGLTVRGAKHVLTHEGQKQFDYAKVGVPMRVY